MKERRINKNIIMVLSFLCVFSFTGCWSMKEPKNVSLVNCSLFDISEDGLYKVTVELINPTGPEGGQQGSALTNRYITKSAVGPSVREAIANLSLTREKIDFGAHNKARIFSEKFAKSDITSVYDVFLREHLIDEKALVFIIKGSDPEKIFVSSPGLSGLIGNYLDSMKKSQPKFTSKGKYITALNFVLDYYDKGKEPAVGTIELIKTSNIPPKQNISSGDDEDIYEIKCEGLAAFKDNKLVGYLDGDETRAYNMITGSDAISIVTVFVDNDKSAVYKIPKSKPDIKLKMDDDKVVIDISIKIAANLSSIDAAIDVTDQDQIKLIETALDDYLKKEIEDTINKVQKQYGGDIFGFGQFMHIQHPDVWKKVEDNWNDYFAKAKINITVKSSVSEMGEIDKPFIMEGTHNEK